MKHETAEQATARRVRLYIEHLHNRGPYDSEACEELDKATQDAITEAIQYEFNLEVNSETK